MAVIPIKAAPSFGKETSATHASENKHGWTRYIILRLDIERTLQK